MLMQSLAATGVLVAALLSSAAHAVPLIEHQGSNDPSSEGWSTLVSGNGAASFIGGSETTASGIHDFWQTQDLSTTGFTAYSFSLGVGDLADNWRLEAKVRVVDSPPVVNSLGGQAVSVLDGLNIWTFNLSNSLVGPVTPALTFARSLALNTVADYHTYVIEMSQNGAGSADDTADFFVDGSLVFDDVMRSELFPASGLLSVRFGNQSTPGLSTARYEFVQFDNGAAAIPEPSMLVLFGSGLACLVGSRFRKRRSLHDGAKLDF